MIVMENVYTLLACLHATLKKISYLSTPSVSCTCIITIFHKILWRYPTCCCFHFIFLCYHHSHHLVIARIALSRNHAFLKMVIKILKKKKRQSTKFNVNKTDFDCQPAYLPLAPLPKIGHIYSENDNQSVLRCIYVYGIFPLSFYLFLTLTKTSNFK